MSKLFGWFNKNKQNQSSQPQPDSPETQIDEQPAQSESSEQVQHETNDTQQEASQPIQQEVTEPAKDVEATVEPVTTDVAEENVADEPVTRDLEDNESLDSEAEAQLSETESQAPLEQDDQEAPQKASFFKRLKASLSRTKANLGSGIVSLFKGKAIDDELYEELETQLLVADVGMDTTQKIISNLTDSAKISQLKDGDALYEKLKQQMGEMLAKVEEPLSVPMSKHDASEGPFVILMVGVNGVGKTTTIGKLAKQFQQQGKKVMLAAGDTFRAAAVEQLQVWGERNDIPVIAQATGADSASVLYDALEAAKARNVDVLIADTAGRLQNKNNLMEELKKVVRVMKKLNPNAPHEVMLTLDAGTGQNAVSQAKIFNEAVGLTGLTLTKLDGTAKGGVIFAIADQFSIPIRCIGVGEGIDDLRPFKGDEFIDALFSEGDNAGE